MENIACVYKITVTVGEEFSIHVEDTLLKTEIATDGTVNIYVLRFLRKEV